MNRLEGPRIRLRQWREADLVPFAQMNGDPRVMRYFAECLSASESNALVQRFAQDIDKSGWGFWAVERLDNSEFIGFIGINYTEQGLPFSPCVDIGWRLSTLNWGQGFATEGAELALRYAFTHAKLTEVVSMTPVSNVGSERVMQKLGMNAQADTFLHPKLEADSPLAEHVLYRISRDQWLSRNQGVEKLNADLK